MTFKFILRSSNGDGNSFVAFIIDQDYISYLKLFREDFSKYDTVTIYKIIDDKLNYLDKLSIDSL